MSRQSRVRAIAIAFSAYIVVGTVDALAEPVDGQTQAVERALAYLAKEVRDWPRNKRCFSCHNSGDGARALLVARQSGHDVDEAATEETHAFLRRPQKWHEGGEDEPFKDKKLATIQFAAALLTAIDAGDVQDRAPLAEGAAMLAEFQADDGAWHVDQTGFGGSPVTYGEALATAMSRRVLVAADRERFGRQIAAADRWLRSNESKRTVDAAGVILGLEGAEDAAANDQRARCVKLLLAAQGDSGGWGLFADRQPEAFDTAIAVIALASVGDQQETAEAIRRACAFLNATQASEGSWEETTRPAGWESYAHRISTTAWATMALLQADSSKRPAGDENASQAGRRPVVQSVKEIGILGKPDSVRGRDGGESALIGGKVLWTFGDTIFNPAAEDGSHFRSNTAALADPDDPLAVHEPTDDAGIPFQAIPFTREELEYNKSTGRPDDRIALWTGGIVPAAASPRFAQGRGLAFFSVIHVGEGMLNYTHRGVATATFAAGETTATRNEGLLFAADEPGFVRPMVHEGMLYLYGGLPDRENLAFGVARAPLDKAIERASYEFWTGSEWRREVEQTVPVFDRIPGGVTVSYNAHLQSFIAVHSGVLTTEVFLRTAPRPEGPWSEPYELFRGEEPQEGFNYAALEHPELAQDNGQRIYVTYHRPLPGLRGELRLVEVTFQ